jgi:hypothetical protein
MFDEGNFLAVPPTWEPYLPHDYRQSGYLAIQYDRANSDNIWKGWAIGKKVRKKGR